MVRCTTSFTTGCKSHVHNSLCKSKINDDIRGEVLSNIGLQQGCPLSPTLFGLHIDEFETYLDKDSSCLLKIVVAILLYVDDVV